ncbi:MAG: helix-turn-helix domain-containing protein [Balneolales bacterium]|nr:helix-turn-helix domain-containing protein [Balneolales bacterium]
MVSLILDRLRRTNSKYHSAIIEWFKSPDYRADAYVEEVLAQISRHLKNENISNVEFAELTKVKKSAVSQFFGADSSIKVKTLFKYTDALGLTLQTPRVIKFDLETIQNTYNQFNDSECTIIKFNSSSWVKGKNETTASPEFKPNNSGLKIVNADSSDRKAS